MKNQWKRVLSVLLSACMLVAMVSVTAVASTTPEISETASVTINGVKVTTGAVVVKGNYYNATELGLVIDATALTDMSGSSWSIKVEGSNDTGYFSNQVVEQKSFVLPSITTGKTEQLTVTIYDSNGEEYGTAELPLYFAEQSEYPLTDAEAAAGAETAFVPAGTIKADVWGYFGMTDGLTSDSRVHVELLNSSGAVCGTTSEEGMGYIHTTYVTDSRYEDIFTDRVPYYVQCMNVGAYIYCGSELAAGTYSLRLRTEDGSVVKTVDNAVVVTDSLMADITTENRLMPAYDEENEVAGAVVRIANGEPKDFVVQLLCDGQVVAQSTSYSYRPLYANGGESEVQYYIPVKQENLYSEPDYDAYLKELGKTSIEELTAEEREWLESRVSYGALTVKLVGADGKTVQGRTETDYRVSGYGLLSEASVLGSHFYANVLLASDGMDPDGRYKLELVKNSASEILGEVLASPDENGIFDVEFTDKNGDLIELEADTQYRVVLYQQYYEGGSWMQQGSVWLSNNDVRNVAYAMSLMSESDTLSLDLYASMSMLANGKINFM